MSLETMIPSEIAQTGKISAGTLAYLGQRARNNCYDYVMRRFLNSEVSKAELARRIGKTPDRVSHMLASPANWTIQTLAELLAGISEEEFLPNSLPLQGRPSQNFTQADLLAEREMLADRPGLDNQSQRQASPRTGGTADTVVARLEYA